VVPLPFYSARSENLHPFHVASKSPKGTSRMDPKPCGMPDARVAALTGDVVPVASRGVCGRAAPDVTRFEFKKPGTTVESNASCGEIEAS